MGPSGLLAAGAGEPRSVFRPSSPGSARPVPVRFSPAPARSCQPLTGLFRPTSANLRPVSARPVPAPLFPSRPVPPRSPFPSATECFCQPLTGLLRPTSVNPLSVSARLRPPRSVSARFCLLLVAFIRTGLFGPAPCRCLFAGRAASRGAEVPAKTVITQKGVRERVPAGVYNLFIKIAAPRWPFGRSAVSLFTCKVSPPAPADAG